MMAHPLSVLSIQSHVVYGHVGNSAAVFPLQRLGAEVWPLHTVQFSNHTGYSGFEGQVFGEGLIRSLVAGLRRARILGSTGKDNFAQDSAFSKVFNRFANTSTCTTTSEGDAIFYIFF